MTLSAVYHPDGASPVPVTFTSDSDCITVTTAGRVTGVSPGRAVITARTADGRHTATCYIEVSENKMCIRDSRKKELWRFGLLSGVGEKAMLEDFERLDPALQALFLRICRPCSGCGGCTKSGKNARFTVTVQANGTSHALCPQFPQHEWQKPCLLYTSSPSLCGGYSSFPRRGREQLWDCTIAAQSKIKSEPVRRLFKFSAPQARKTLGLHSGDNSRTE